MQEKNVKLFHFFAKVGEREQFFTGKWSDGMVE